jgi:hypothetical protein
MIEPIQAQPRPSQPPPQPQLPPTQWVPRQPVFYPSPPPPEHLTGLTVFGVRVSLPWVIAVSVLIGAFGWPYVRARIAGWSANR